MTILVHFFIYPIALGRKGPHPVNAVPSWQCPSTSRVAFILFKARGFLFRLRHERAVKIAPCGSSAHESFRTSPRWSRQGLSERFCKSLDRCTDNRRSGPRRRLVRSKLEAVGRAKVLKHRIKSSEILFIRKNRQDERHREAAVYKSADTRVASPRIYEHVIEIKCLPPVLLEIFKHHKSVMFLNKAAPGRYSAAV